MASRRRVVLGSGALAAAVAVLVGGWATASRADPAPAAHPAAGSHVRDARPAPRHRARRGARRGVARETLVATVRPAGAPGSRVPGGRATEVVPGRWLGAASVLPVVAQRRGWVEVRLAQRPNGSVAWVPVRDVRLAADPYRIVVDLATTHLELFERGREVGDFPAGVGVPSAPTPTGQFFVALFAEPPSPAYGAFVMVTSAHSDAISDWEQSGDAITAIHGPLGSDAAIGTTGARVSHGCVRLHEADLVRLRDVPAGTPVDIVG